MSPFPFDPSLIDPRILTSLGLPRADAGMSGGPMGGQKLSLWDRMQQVVSPAPTDGLLSEQDVKNARNQGLLNFGTSLLAQSGPTDMAHRVTFGQAVGQAAQSGVGTYHNAVDAQRQAMQQKQAFDVNKLKMTGMQQELAHNTKTQADADKAEAARNAVFAQYPPPTDNKDPKAVTDWIDQVTPSLVAAQDFDGAEKLTALRKAMAERQKKYQFVQGGDEVYVGDPDTGTLTPGAARGVPADQLEMKRLQLSEQRARTAAMQDQASAGRADRLTTAYDRNTKPLFDRAMPINQAQMAIEQAKTDPTVGGNAIIAFMTAVDPKAQQRYQMVQWMSQHLTPSLAATAQRYLEGKTTGLLPKELLDAMAAHVRRTRDITVGQAERARTEYERIHPEVRGQLRNISTEFSPDAPAAAQPSLNDLWNGQ